MIVTGMIERYKTRYIVRRLENTVDNDNIFESGKRTEAKRRSSLIPFVNIPSAELQVEW